MITIASIVEGQSEIDSVPILIHRIREIVAPQVLVRTTHPIRVPRQSVIKPENFEKYVDLAARESGHGGRILVLLDADDDCPIELAGDLLERARISRSDRTVSVVLAKAEFESWFLASINSIVGKFSIERDCKRPTDPEGIRDAKRWLSKSMLKGHSYQSAIHQPEIARVFDMNLARINSPSFDKFWRDIEALISNR